MMRRLIVLELFSGPAWCDASNMQAHIPVGEAGAWLMIRPGVVQVVDATSDNTQQLQDGRAGSPSFHCHTWYTTAGTDRPTVHTVAVGDADLYGEVLMSIGFRLENPDGIELQKDESGVYWGYYV